MENETIDAMADRVIAAMEAAVAVQVAKQMRNIGAETENELLRLVQQISLKVDGLQHQNERNREHIGAVDRGLKEQREKLDRHIKNG